MVLEGGIQGPGLGQEGPGLNWEGFAPLFMKETALWNKVKPHLNRVGLFQKISDRFTPGVPDVLGVYQGRGIAIELKELKGVRIFRAKFRPGQLDFLRDWEKAGGLSVVLSTTRSRQIYVHPWSFGETLESGVNPETLNEAALIVHPPKWGEFTNLFLELTCE